MLFREYKGAISLAIISISLLLVVAVDYLRSDYKDILKESKRVVALTKLSSASYGAFRFEPRVRRFQPHHYSIYPEMPPADRLNFIYKLKESIYNAN